MATEAPSKAFRARIYLADHEVFRVQRWAALNCALSATFRNERGITILIGLRDTARTSASFARSIRSALVNMGVAATPALRGKWCTLISEKEAVALCVDTATAFRDEPSRAESRTVSCAVSGPGIACDDDDARVVNLLR